jgi:hypothetical protein
MPEEMRVNDVQLNVSDIRQLENADEMAHVFAKPRYDVDERTNIPGYGVLGMSSKDMSQHIHKIELRGIAMTIAEILQQAKTLGLQERKELVKLLVDSLDMSEAVPRQQRYLSELRGLGKETWEGIDAQEYVNQLRSEWDERP